MATAINATGGHYIPNACRTMTVDMTIKVSVNIMKVVCLSVISTSW